MPAKLLPVEDGKVMDAKMAAVEEVEVVEVKCGGRCTGLGMGGGGLSCPLGVAILRGRETMREEVAVGRADGVYLARATAFVILAAAIADTLIEEDFGCFRMPLAFVLMVCETELVAVELSRVVSLVSCKQERETLACWSEESLGGEREGRGGERGGRRKVREEGEGR